MTAITGMTAVADELTTRPAELLVTQDLGMMRPPGNNLPDRQRVPVVLPPV